jgi:hypothetical protein
MRSLGPWQIRMAILLVLAALSIGCHNGAEPLRASLLRCNTAWDDGQGRTADDFYSICDALVKKTKANPDEFIQLYETDKDPNVRSWCAFFLGMAKTKDAAPHLASGIIRDPNSSVIDHSALSLRQLLDAYSEDPIVKDASSRGALAWIDKSLSGQKLHTFGAVTDIVKQLKDSSFVDPLRKLAIHSGTTTGYANVVDLIHAIGGQKSTEALRELRSASKDPKQRAYIDKLIRS